MACNHSSVAVDVQHVANNSLAVVLFQGIRNNITAPTDIRGVFPLRKLPAELQNKIIGYAMSAINQEINLPCLTNAGFKPNVAVNLFLVDHRIYHEAQYQFRKQNTFVFGNFGSDLKTVTSSVGPLKCRSGACGHGPLYSKFAKVTFDLGDEDMPGTATDKVYAFGCALRYLRSQVIVDSLHLRFAYFTFQSSAQLSDFASGLRKIKVQEQLIITGDERILDMSFGEFPSKLGMNMMPVFTHFQAYHPGIQYSPGSFFHQYLPENYVGKGPDPQKKYLIIDPTQLYKAENAFGEKLVS